jgi:hypothetical protein
MGPAARGAQTEGGHGEYPFVSIMNPNAKSDAESFFFRGRGPSKNFGWTFVTERGGSGFLQKSSFYCPNIK